MKRLEALADALSALCSAHDPDSEAYRLRNPILLKAFNPRHDRNENGYRTFKHFVAGYDNALLDLEIKCSGKSWSKLTPDSQLPELVSTYGHSPAAARYVAKFLRKALKDETITDATRLGWFLTDQEVNDAGNSDGTAA